MQRRQLLAGLFVATLFGCSTSSDAQLSHSQKDLKPLTVDQVEARIAAHDSHTFVFDDNPKESWVKAHVPTAKWLDEVTADAMPKDKAATLIFYCHNET